MKNLPFVLITICAILICFSCKQKTIPETKKHPNLISLEEVDTVTEAEYKSWVDGWKAKGKRHMDSSLIEYFTMPLVDLSQFSNHASKSARLVFGMDTTIYPMEAHLMLVTTGKNNVAITPPHANVYDLSTPCPRVCHPPRE